MKNYLLQNLSLISILILLPLNSYALSNNSSSTSLSPQALAILDAAAEKKFESYARRMKKPLYPGDLATTSKQIEKEDSSKNDYERCLKQIEKDNSKKENRN